MDRHKGIDRRLGIEDTNAAWRCEFYEAVSQLTSQGIQAMTQETNGISNHHMDMGMHLLLLERHTFLSDKTRCDGGT